MWGKKEISPFPTVFEKRLLLKTRKNHNLFGKGLGLKESSSFYREDSKLSERNSVSEYSIKDLIFTCKHDLREKN